MNTKQSKLLGTEHFIFLGVGIYKTCDRAVYKRQIACHSFSKRSEYLIDV